MSLAKMRFIAGVLLLCAAISADAQIRSGTITGLVTDTAGAVVPNADVLVTDQETGIKNTTKTTEAGLFTIPYLPAGTYSISVSLAGFSTYRESGIALETAQTVRVNVSLKLGTVESAVEVTAQAQQVQTDSATVQASTQSDLIT